jgi:hypothetical protein
MSGYNAVATAQDVVIDGCIVANNGTGTTYHGINLSNFASLVTVKNNTIYGNLGDGIFQLDSANVRGNRITNNTSSNNGRYGYNFDGVMRDLLFSNNHADGNNSSNPAFYCDLTASLAEFEVFGEGNNIGGDPDLTDYIPSDSSPLIDAGVGGTGDTIGALCATAGGGAGGGAVNLLHGTFG